MSGQEKTTNHGRGGGFLPWEGSADHASLVDHEGKEPIRIGLLLLLFLHTNIHANQRTACD